MDRREEAAQFFVKTLQLIVDSQGDSKRIYPVWAKEQAQLNTTLLGELPTIVNRLYEQNAGQKISISSVLVKFGDILQQFPLGTRWLNLELSITAYQQALAVITKADLPVQWSKVMMSLAVAYTARIRGNKAQNIEDAIDAYKQSLTVRTQTTMPVEWAQTMMNMGIAYTERIRGDKARNIEDAIFAYKQSLTVRTQTTMPIEWAQTMMNMASAYAARIQGDKAQNMEDAIVACQQTLIVRTKVAMPVDWATTMNNLASAYVQRIRGNNAQNIEDAIAAYQQSLSVRTKAAMPVDWADTMMNLASACLKRIQGDRAQNIEDAINFYQQALTVKTHEAMPVQWAQAMNNLANAYLNRVLGDRAQNIEDAIGAYKQFLTVVPQSYIPIEWAQTINNLANAYVQRIRGNNAQNIEDAITAYNQALTVRTKVATPVDWADTMMNLASACLKRIRGDRAQNIEDAINFYQQALTVKTQESMPVQWAKTMNNLASAYYWRVQGDKNQNLEDAINIYKSSLEVFAPQAFPHYCRITARSLGDLYSYRHRWQDAVSIYTEAIEASDILYRSADLLGNKGAELSVTADLPRRMAYALAHTNNFSKAVETLEQGRARALSETLDRDRANLDQIQQQNPDLYQQYKDLTNQLRNIEALQRDRMVSRDRHSLTPEALRNNAISLREVLTTTIDQIRQQPGYESFLTLPTFEDVKQAATPGHPLIYLITIPAGSLALIVTPNTTDHLWLDDFTDTHLIDLLQAWFAAYNNAQQNRQAWYDTIEATTKKLWEPIIGPLVQQIKELGYDRITLIPTGYLSLLPLHAAWTEDPSSPTGRRYAFDDIHITYAPNAKSLTAAQSIADRVQTDSILAIDNPRQDLPNSEREITAAVERFSNRTILRHNQATIAAVKAQLPRANIVHFSCHGTADLNEPLNSGLAMSEGLLTLKDIFALNLAESGGLRLAILSACETGIQGLENADEVISLPTGLLQAGVAAVISSLWSVSDLSTMLLLARFYDLWRNDSSSPSVALHQAQQWVRDTTNQEKYDYLKNHFQALACTQQISEQEVNNLLRDFMIRHIYQDDPESRSFAHPFHWAAFSYTGV